MKLHHKKRQQGATMILTLVFMIGMLGMIGLAIDTGHVLLNKTRLQNALDAAALSAAIVLNGPTNNSTAEASAAGRETFGLFKNHAGNDELPESSSLSFLYSDSVSSFLPGNGIGPYVRVSSSVLVTNFFIQVVGNISENVGAISTAGPTGQNCNIVPFVLCAGDADPNVEGVQIDSNCDDDTDGDGFIDCYGYNINEEVGIHEKPTCKTGDQACIDTSLETGHFQLLSVADSNSGADIRDSIAGEIDSCTTATEDLNLAPGGKIGPVSQGVDLRISRDTVTTSYSTEQYYNPDNNAEDAYRADQLIPDNPSGIKNKRIMVIPVGNCVGIQSGETSIKDEARMCALVKRPSDKPPKNTIYIETLEEKSCPSLGQTDPENPIIYGPFKIVLFKSQNSGDS